MRLTCPNCSARYEVADSMVPPEGRDVQCSNCSTTWFQPGRRIEARPTVTVTRSTPAAETEVAQPPPTAAEPERTPEAPSATPPAPELAGDQPRRRTLDPDLRSILEQEAEREARLRRAEADPVETQDEMSLGQEPEDAHRARRRAELDAARDAFDSDPAAEATTVSSARDLFPDIDEINSTLRDTGDRSGTEADASDIDTLDTIPRRRRGTRIGFLLVLAIAAGGAALYTNADTVARAVPALEPALSGYVMVVNGARFWLDDLAQGLAGATPEG
ncbi:zinc-ribbon domain-containing protein [Roseicyclus mahoneyensis]|uniref:Putative Zn finger-like uncharacterized protein n=1 Tax=Roseicyclus mahoneyensis TaxID=164332 RepID=A0A316GHV9_9RHOB|nr:zinc-ribbon domain-containing protein [Roseicyclus mahoneyensis]PWK60181.1 putative Zn finger-like uncharacterized protein [Roseicyclus mahoneyensis]